MSSMSYYVEDHRADRGLPKGLPLLRRGDLRLPTVLPLAPPQMQGYQRTPHLWSPATGSVSRYPFGVTTSLRARGSGMGTSGSGFQASARGFLVSCCLLCVHFACHVAPFLWLPWAGRATPKSKERCGVEGRVGGNTAKTTPLGLESLQAPVSMLEFWRRMTFHCPAHKVPRHHTRDPKLLNHSATSFAPRNQP